MEAGQHLPGVISCSDAQHRAAQAQEWGWGALKDPQGPQTISTKVPKNRLHMFTPLQEEPET